MKKISVICVALGAMSSVFLLTGCDKDSKIIVINESCTKNDSNVNNESLKDYIPLTDSSLNYYNNSLFF